MGLWWKELGFEVGGGSRAVMLGQGRVGEARAVMHVLDWVEILVKDGERLVTSVALSVATSMMLLMVLTMAATMMVFMVVTSMVLHKECHTSTSG